jgi:hypothetical protein
MNISGALQDFRPIRCSCAKYVSNVEIRASDRKLRSSGLRHSDPIHSSYLANVRVRGG